MNLKELIYRKGIRQVDLVKALGVDPSRISLQINGIRPLPRKHKDKLCNLLGISKEQLEMFLNETGGKK